MIIIGYVIAREERPKQSIFNDKWIAASLRQASLLAMT